MILDGGATPLGLESTVIGFDGQTPVLLRPGAITREEVEAVTGPLAVPDAAKRRQRNGFEPGTRQRQTDVGGGGPYVEEPAPPAVDAPTTTLPPTTTTTFPTSGTTGGLFSPG